jgi:hypothetical protein
MAIVVVVVVEIVDEMLETAPINGMTRAVFTNSDSAIGINRAVVAAELNA